MSANEGLTRQLGEAYEHLYDIVYLRTHPLSDGLGRDAGGNRKENAWQLHQLLLDLIDDLDPGKSAPPLSREWRRHRLMVFRYVDGMDPATVADRLSISLRTYYRELQQAMEAVAELLEDRLGQTAFGDAQPVEPDTKETSPDRLELVRLEATRLALARSYTSLGQVVQGAAELLQEMVASKGIAVGIELAQASASLSVDRNIVRQILLEMMSYLVESFQAGCLRIWSEKEPQHARLALQLCGDWQAERARRGREDHLKIVEELATTQRITWQSITQDGMVIGFRLLLPYAPVRTVLVADDNEDTVELFTRYLTQHDYTVVSAGTAAETLAQASAVRPFAIILDLMMPDQDGWEILQKLTHQPQTRNIPIIICTVLSAKQLALSLGATLFLEKPVSEQVLLAALRSLDPT